MRPISREDLEPQLDGYKGGKKPSPGYPEIDWEGKDRGQSYYGLVNRTGIVENLEVDASWKSDWGWISGIFRKPLLYGIYQSVFRPWLCCIFLTTVLKFGCHYEYVHKNTPEDVKDLHKILGSFLGFILALEVNQSAGFFFQGREAMGNQIHAFRRLVCISTTFIPAQDDEQTVHSLRVLFNTLYMQINLCVGLMRQNVRESRAHFRKSTTPFDSNTWWRDPCLPEIKQFLTGPGKYPSRKKIKFTKHDRMVDTDVNEASVREAETKQNSLNTPLKEDRPSKVGLRKRVNTKVSSPWGKVCPTESKEWGPNDDWDDRAQLSRLDPSMRVVKVEQWIYRTCQLISRELDNPDRYLQLALPLISEASDAHWACIKIVTSPMPQNYIHLVHVLLFIFVFSTPFVYLNDFSSATSGFESYTAITIICIGYYGVIAISHKMHNPFGWDRLDLNLETFCQTVMRETRLLLPEGVDRYTKWDQEQKEELIRQSSTRVSPPPQRSTREYK